MSFFEDLIQLRQQRVDLGARLLDVFFLSISPGWHAAWRKRSNASST